MRRMNLVVLLMVGFAVSLLAGCATTTSRTGEDLSWWGKSGAEPAPVKDADTAVPSNDPLKEGSWWMPDRAATSAENNTQWGNRSYVYVNKTPEVPAPVPEVVAPKPAEKIVEKQLVVEKDVYFLYDSSALTPFTRGILDHNVEVFKQYPKIKAILIGYASPEGTDEYNLKLSERRATAVKDYLVQAGIPEDILKIKTMGELQAAKSSWPFARKVHFEIISE